MASTKYSYVSERLGISDIIEIPLSTRLILEQADEFGVAWEAIPNTKIIKLEYGGKIKFFRWQISSETSFIGFNACLDKGETKALLQQAGISTPNGCKLTPEDSEEIWEQVYNSLQKPLVIKPSHGWQGQSVLMGINDLAAYKVAVKKCFAFTDAEDSGVMVEETFVGKEYRLVTTRQKMVAAVYREPANVIGDGTETVAELVAEKNSDPRRGSDLSFALFKIELDEDALETLAGQNLTPTSVPTDGQKVYLRRVSNIMRGGDSIDITDEIHPSVKEIAVKAVQAVPELDFVGVDFMTKDIYTPQTPDSYIVVELNSSPGICINEMAYTGKKHYSDREFLFCSFPELRAKYESSI